jgi:hypothetical protein
LKKRILAMSLAFGVGAFMFMAGFSFHVGDGAATGTGGLTLSITNEASAAGEGSMGIWNWGYITDCPKTYSQFNSDCQKLCDATYSRSSEREACRQGCGKMVQAIGNAGCFGGSGYGGHTYCKIIPRLSK